MTSTLDTLLDMVLGDARSLGKSFLGGWWVRRVVRGQGESLVFLRASASAKRDGNKCRWPIGLAYLKGKASVCQSRGKYRWSVHVSAQKLCFA